MNLQEIRGRLDKSGDRDQWYDAHEMAEALEFAGVDASTIKDDAEFIAHAPTDVARLLNALEAVEGLTENRAQLLRETADRLNQQVINGDHAQDDSFVAFRYSAYAVEAESIAIYVRNAVERAVTKSIGGNGK